jgi:hypothetical protein
MRTIWKFEFETKDEIQIEMPKGAFILDVQVQKGQPCIWAKVDSEAGKEIRTFRIHGTGHPILEARSKGYEYLGTYQLMNGDLVFHLVEVVKRTAV